MAAVNDEYKDRLFSFIFGREENRKWTLELYNAINGSHYENPDDIKITTIEEVLYLGMHNDVSFMISDEMSLYEQQSTYNPNMPVRQLQYCGYLYEKYIKENKLNKFGSRLIQLPVPRLVVFYNGTTDEPDEKILKLNMEIEQAVDLAVSQMPKDYILKPFLEIHKAEVKGMMLTEYDEAETMNMFKEEGRQEGMQQGVQQGVQQGTYNTLVALVKKNLLSIKDAANQAGISEEAFRKKMPTN